MFGFSRANIFLGNKNDSSNKDIFGESDSSTTKKYVWNNSERSSTNVDVENVDLDEEFIDNSSLGTDTNEDDFSSNQYSEYILNQYMNKYGDVDGDGVISIKDITTIQQQLANNGLSSNGAGDVNCDGKIDDKDIALIQQYLSGNVITPTNIEMANKMDVIKYSHIRSQTANELRDKNITLQKIKNSIGYHELDDEIKTKQENSHGNRLIKNKEKGYMHYVNKNNNSNTNTNNSINRNPFGSSEEGQKKNTLYNIYKNNKLTAAEEEALIKEFGSLAAAQSAYEMNVASLNYSKKELDKQIDLVPYNNLMNTADFKKWANNKFISDFDPNNNPDLANSSKYITSYKYLSAGQLAMYNYLLDTKGKEEADKYIDLYQDDINKAIGLERANKLINQLDKDFSKIIREDDSLMDDTDMKKLQNLLDKNQYDKSYDINGDGKLTDEDMSKLKQYIETGGEIESTFKNMGITFGGGFQDGWNNFFEGFKYVFDDSAVLSPEEYKMMFIAQKLEQNGVIKSSYEFGQTVGNMTPVILASAVATAATAPFGGEGGAAVFGTSLSAQQIGQYTAAALIFTSTYGKSKHEASCNGHSLESAIGYATLSGLSEAGLETLLGSIPGVGKECKNIFVGMFKEGLSESAQELVGSMIGYYTLGEEKDVSDLSADMGKAFIYGALLSGASNGFSSGLKIVVNGVKYNLTRQQIMDYYNASIDPVTGENNGLTLQEYVQENINPITEQSNYESYTDQINLEDYNDSVSNKTWGLDRILDGKFKRQCDIIFNNITDVETKKVLEDILLRGEYDGFSFASDILHKDNPSLEGQRRLGMANLFLSNPETFKVMCDKKINLFHGTNGAALNGIVENGMMNMYDLNQTGYDVQTGEVFSRIDGKPRGFVSFADILDISSSYATLSPGDVVAGSNMDFPVLVGITTDTAKSSGIVSVHSDVSEVAVKGVSSDNVDVICVPPDKVEFVKQIVGDKDITVMPIDFDFIYNNRLYSSVY